MSHVRRRVLPHNELAATRSEEAEREAHSRVPRRSHGNVIVRYHEGGEGYAALQIGSRIIAFLSGNKVAGG